MQLDLFERNELVLILDELAKMKESNANVRRGCFARIAEFEKLIKDLKQEMQKVKAE